VPNYFAWTAIHRPIAKNLYPVAPKSFLGSTWSLISNRPRHVSWEAFHQQARFLDLATHVSSSAIGRRVRRFTLVGLGLLATIEIGYPKELMA